MLSTPSPKARRNSKVSPRDFRKALQQEQLGARAKVRSWNTAGGGVVTPDDVDAATKDEPKQSASEGAAKDAVVGPSLELGSPVIVVEEQIGSELAVEVVVVEEDESKNPLPTKQLPHNELDDDIRAAIAPKKRVISDGHWRKDGSPEKQPSPPKKPIDLNRAWIRPSAAKALEKKLLDAQKKKEAEEAVRGNPKPQPTRPYAAVRKRRPSIVAKGDEAVIVRPDALKIPTIQQSAPAKVDQWLHNAVEAIELSPEPPKPRKKRRPAQSTSGDEAEGSGKSTTDKSNVKTNDSSTAITSTVLSSPPRSSKSPPPRQHRRQKSAPLKAESGIDIAPPEKIRSSPKSADGRTSSLVPRPRNRNGPTSSSVSLPTSVDGKTSSSVSRPKSSGGKTTSSLSREEERPRSPPSRPRKRRSAERLHYSSDRESKEFIPCLVKSTRSSPRSSTTFDETDRSQTTASKPRKRRSNERLRHYSDQESLPRPQKPSRSSPASPTFETDSPRASSNKLRKRSSAEKIRHYSDQESLPPPRRTSKKDDELRHFKSPLRSSNLEESDPTTPNPSRPRKRRSAERLRHYSDQESLPWPRRTSQKHLEPNHARSSPVSPVSPTSPALETTPRPRGPRPRTVSQRERDKEVEAAVNVLSVDMRSRSDRSDGSGGRRRTQRKSQDKENQSPSALSEEVQRTPRARYTRLEDVSTPTRPSSGRKSRSPPSRQDRSAEPSRSRKVRELVDLYQSPPPVADESPRSNQRRNSWQKVDAGERVTNTKSSTSPSPANPQTPTMVFGTRVEAWLTTTPDPFADSDRRRRKSTYDRPIDDQSDISSQNPSALSKTTLTETESELSRYEMSGALPALSRDESTVTASTESNDDSVMTPVSLKQTSARRAQETPTKGRRSPYHAERDLPLDDDVSSTARSSSVNPSSIDLPDVTPKAQAPVEILPALKRAFPTTGKRLSTILSVETFETKSAGPSSVVSEESDVTIQPTQLDNGSFVTSVLGSSILSGTGTGRTRTSLKRRLTKHSDLMSVLSIPQTGTKSIISARSIRTNRSRLATATVPDLLDELALEETKYMLELRTLADSVIPVLLRLVLSKSDAAVAAGLFSRAAAFKKDQQHLTGPIRDMGVALERLKSKHKVIPKHDPDSLLAWAKGAHKVYSDYLKAWRLGFQDVIINLAPADYEGRSVSSSVAKQTDVAWEEGLPRNEEGYVVNGDGERVDVAFLLKRPLVRLKYLAKTFKGIHVIKPSPQAEDVMKIYQELVAYARRRNDEERARLEDEAAYTIDATRSRDPKSLAPLNGVTIDPNRFVRARDYFDLHLPHSSGQAVDCRVELILRDDARGKEIRGDLLICELDDTGRWLLFPPILLNHVSARNGDMQGEIVVMIRGVHSGGEEWRELMSLQTDDEATGFEWVRMFGLEPIPPELPRMAGFAGKAKRPTSSHGVLTLSPPQTSSGSPMKSRTPSPREIEIPIGERAGAASKKWTDDTTKELPLPVPPPTTPPKDNSPTLPKSSSHGSVSPPTSRSPSIQKDLPALPSSTPRAATISIQRKPVVPWKVKETTQTDGATSPTTLKRTRAKRYKNSPVSPRSPIHGADSQDEQRELTSPPRIPSLRKPRPLSLPNDTSKLSSTPGYSVWMPQSEPESSDESEEDAPLPPPSSVLKPPMHRRASSVPSLDLPTIPKLRKTSVPNIEPVLQDDTLGRTKWEAAPKRTPSKLKKSRSEGMRTEPNSPIVSIPPPQPDAPPPPPPHRSPSNVKLGAHPIPQFTPTKHVRRRSSSPLKHEYQPSTASESSTSSEDSISEDEDSITSESEDWSSEEDDMLGSLKPLGALRPLSKAAPSPPDSLYSSERSGTIGPSQSASQAPYRAVPRQTGVTSKVIASIFMWSDAGQWTPLHPDECSIVITPGLIEAFEASAAQSDLSHSSASSNDSSARPTGKPLVALELTPLVPLRRGTALDISIRSPPTSNSKIQASSNIMFRSRSPEECEQLYGLINNSRINNPTYIALQNARGTHAEGSWAAAMDRRNNARTSSGGTNGGGSWWSFGGSSKSKSYRAHSTRAGSVSVNTDSSVGTMASAFSAIKRFSVRGMTKMGKPGYSSRDGSDTMDSWDSMGSGSGGSGGSGATTPPFGAAGPGLPLSIIKDTKIRLYVRESASKWRDLGPARLSIMQPEREPPITGMRPHTSDGQSIGGNRQSIFGSPAGLKTGNEKRIIVTGKSDGNLVLDATLAEGCFERVARTGIAVSVWEDIVGPNGEIVNVAHTGGVGSQKVTVYMIQMKNERECVYSYSLLGKMRY